MAVKNRGTEFQTIFKNSCKEFEIDCIRLYDTLQGYKAVANPCDFIISRGIEEPAILIECKSTHSSSFSLNFRQLPLLRDLSCFRSYVIIWFVERKEVWALSTQEVLDLQKRGHKSFNPEKHSYYAGKKLDTHFKTVKPSLICVSALWFEIKD